MKLSGNQFLAAFAGLFVVALVGFLSLRESGDVEPLVAPAAAAVPAQPATSARTSRPTELVSDPFVGKPRNDSVDSGTEAARRAKADQAAEARSVSKTATTAPAPAAVPAAPIPSSPVQASTPAPVSESVLTSSSTTATVPSAPVVPVVVASKTTQKLAASSRRLVRLCKSFKKLSDAEGDTDGLSGFRAETRSVDHIADELEDVLGFYFDDKDGTWKGQSAREVMIEIAETLLYTCELPTFSSVISRTVTETTAPRLSTEDLIALLTAP